MKLYNILIFFFIGIFSDIRTHYSQQLERALHYMQSGQYHQAIDEYTSLLNVAPTHSGIMGNIGYAYKKIHDYQQAIEWYQRALQYDPTNARLLRGISHAYLMIGDFEHGWPAYEYRWVQPPHFNAEFIALMHAGDALHNRTIIIHAEYGLGDVLHFIRYAQLLHNRGATVIVESHERLIPLLSLCPYIDRIIAPHEALPPHDFRVMVMSLPLAFKTTLATIPTSVPYLYADEQLVTFWKEELSQNTYNIGICWLANMHAGSADRTVLQDGKNKSIPTTLLQPLTRIPHIQLYALHHDTIDNKALPIIAFDDFDTSHGAFMDSAALIQNLDLVITVDTAIAHLAGGLGIRTWLLLPYHADWRWMQSIDYSPWYPTVTLFRQTVDGEWQSVIEDVCHALRLESAL